MAQRNPSGKDRRGRVLVNFFWMAAGTIFVAGAVLRLIASLSTRSDIRIGGVVLLGIGAVMGVIGWLGERYVVNRVR
jgi:hypothetical protein